METIQVREDPPPGIEKVLHPLRSAILNALSSAGSPMSFKGISEGTGIAPSLCAYHLRLLGERGLVKRSFDHGEDRKEYYYYTLTERGSEALRLERRLLKGTDRDAVNPLTGIAIVSWRNMPRCFIIGGD